MKNYDKILKFYSLLVELLKHEPFSQATAKNLVKLHGEIKSFIGVKEFCLKYAEYFYNDVDVREEYLQIAFQDLAPHLRDPKAREIIRLLSSHTSPCGKELNIHVKNVKLFDSKPEGAAVLTIIVDSYECFMDLIAKQHYKRPDYVHTTLSKSVSV